MSDSKSEKEKELAKAARRPLPEFPPNIEIKMGHPPPMREILPIHIKK